MTLHRFAFAVLSVCFIGSLAFASELATSPNDGSAEFLASYYAMALAHAKNFDGLEKSLQLSGADRKDLQNDIKSHGWGSREVPTARAENTQLIISDKLGHKTIVDFKDVSNSAIEFDGNKIDLNKEVNYRKAKLWAETVKPRKSVLLWRVSVPTAQAQGNDHSWSSTLGAVFSSSYWMNKISKGSRTNRPEFVQPTIHLEEFLISAYDHAGRENVSSAEAFTIPIFTCQGNHVQSITWQDYNETVYGKAITLNFDAKSGYSFTAGDCQFKAGQGGMVTSSSNSIECPRKGENMSSMALISNFPATASMCCSRTAQRCPQRVQAAIGRIDKRAQRSTPDTGSAL